MTKAFASPTPPLLDKYMYHETNISISSNLSCGGGAYTIFENFKGRCHKGLFAWYFFSFPKGQWGEACIVIDASRANERSCLCNIAWYICFSFS